jgi:hypothetical protein
MKGNNTTGHCLCKQVGYAISGPVRNLCFCHCESCRRAVGSAYVAWGTTDADKFQLTRGELRLVSSSTGVSRGFCGHCGSSITYQNALRADEIDFTLATLQDPSMYAPQAHIWVQDKVPWVRIHDGLPEYPTVIP